MRVLIVGTVPPPGGPGARALAAVAAARTERGDEVEVWSKNPRSAAHRTVLFGGLALVVELALASRRFDALELRIESGLPLSPSAGRGSRAMVLLALGTAVSRFSEVTLRLDSPVPIPGGLGGRATTAFWHAASSIVVADPADRAMVLAVPGIDPDRVGFEAARSEQIPVEPRWPSAEDPDLREAVLDLVRSRAERDRAVVRARAVLGADLGPTPDSALVTASGSSPWPRLGGVAVMLGRRTLGKARRLLRTR